MLSLTDGWSSNQTLVNDPRVLFLSLLQPYICVREGFESPGCWICLLTKHLKTVTKITTLHYRINDDRCLWCFLHHLLKIYWFGSLFTSIHMHTETHTNMYVHKICMYAYSLVRRFPSAFAHQQMSTKIFVLWSCGCSYLMSKGYFLFWLFTCVLWTGLLPVCLIPSS